MALNINNLASYIRDEMGFSGPLSDQLLLWSRALIEELQQASVSHSTGRITGDCPPTGGDLEDGAGTNGTISGMSSNNLSNKVVNLMNYPYTSHELNRFCFHIVNHIQTSSNVIFEEDDITGICTNTSINPGILISGKGENGKIIGLNGFSLAVSIHNDLYSQHQGPTLKLRQFCNALFNYIMENADVTYSSGLVNGVCPIGGGPLQFGSASNGSIN